MHYNTHTNIGIIQKQKIRLVKLIVNYQMYL
nr:MAG TPA: hypothetical protein [Caudoviricetes sp.]